MRPNHDQVGAPFVGRGEQSMPRILAADERLRLVAERLGQLLARFVEHGVGEGLVHLAKHRRVGSLAAHAQLGG